MDFRPIGTRDQHQVAVVQEIVARPPLLESLRENFVGQRRNALRFLRARFLEFKIADISLKRWAVAAILFSASRSGATHDQFEREAKTPPRAHPLFGRCLALALVKRGDSVVKSHPFFGDKFGKIGCGLLESREFGFLGVEFLALCRDGRKRSVKAFGAVTDSKRKIARVGKHLPRFAQPLLAKTNGFRCFSLLATSGLVRIGIEHRDGHSALALADIAPLAPRLDKRADGET